MIELAIWFHDIVYDTTLPRGVNEERSAAMLGQFSTDCKDALFKSGLSLHGDHVLGLHAVPQLQQWILQTQKHFDRAYDQEASNFTVGLKKDFDFFMDCDVMVLGLEADAYETYARDVRVEYEHIPMQLYRKHRAEVLRAFSTSTHLFRTDLFQTRYEAQARVNMLWEAHTHTHTDP